MQNYDMQNLQLALFDDQFSISGLNSIVQDREKKVDKSFDSLRNAIKMALIKDNKDEETKYVVDIPEDIRKAIKDGKVELLKSKDGGLFATIRDSESKRIKKQLSIKEEMQKEGITEDQLNYAFQMDAIKEQLSQIIDKMQDIEDYIQEVIQGQYDDRLGRLYGGLNLYIESTQVRDEFFRKQLLAQALQSINDSSAQMIQSIRSSMFYLIDDNHKKTSKKVEEHIDNVHKCCDAVYKASVLKAIIYQDNSELDAMLNALAQYGRFVGRIIEPNVATLSELDKNTMFIDKGAWTKIAEAPMICEMMMLKIERSKNMFLEMEV